MRTTLQRRLAAVALAVGLSTALAACGAAGPGAGASESGAAATAATPAGTPGASESSGAEECAAIERTMMGLSDRLAGLDAKVPGDLPGAIADIQASVDELTSLSSTLQAGTAKTHVDNVIGYGTEALDILTRMQSGELSTVEGMAQGTAKLTQVTAELSALSDYCAAA